MANSLNGSKFRRRKLGFYIAVGFRILKRKAELFWRTFCNPEPCTAAAAAQSLFLRRLNIAQSRDYSINVARVRLEQVAKVTEAARNLIRHFLRHFVNLRKLVYSLFFRKDILVLCLVHAPNDALCLVVILVCLDNVKVETDGELCVRTRTGEQVARNFRRINA